MGKLYLVEFCKHSACKLMRLCDKHMDDVLLDMIIFIIGSYSGSSLALLHMVYLERYHDKAG